MDSVWLQNMQQDKQSLLESIRVWAKLVSPNWEAVIGSK